jgi:hypothetical protein
MSGVKARPTARAGRVVLLAFFGAATLAPAQAQVPTCSAAAAGELSVQADVSCECRFFQASVMAGTPSGYHWDCGILRPRLNYSVPVDLNPYPYPLPEGLSVELPGSSLDQPGSGEQQLPVRPKRR